MTFRCPLVDTSWPVLCFDEDSSGDVFRLRMSSRSDIRSKSKGVGFAESRLIRVFLISLLLMFVLLLYEG